MIDVNTPLRKAYFTALSGIVYNAVAIPVYYSYLPDDLSPDDYILYAPVSNNNAGTIHTQDTFSSMRVTVYTVGNKNNDGNACDDIAGQVLTRIYPTPSFNVPLPTGTALQVTGTTLESDIAQEFSMQSGKVFLNRIITFRHTILQK